MAEKKLPKGIRKNGNRYQGRIMFQGKNYSVTGATITETKKAMTDLKYRLEHGLFVEREKVTLDSWFQTWIKEYKQNDLKAGTLIAYQNYYNYYIKESLGKMSISTIRGEHIQKLYNKLLDDDMALSSLKIISAVMNGCFQRALKNGLIERNPVKLAELPRKKQKTERRVLTLKEQELFFQYSKESYLNNLFALMVRTGMRSGEARGLKFSDVDNRNNVIHIRRTLKYETGKGFFEDTPKTSTSMRDIPLTPEITAIIDSQRKITREYSNVVNIDEYVFHLPEGTPISRERVQSEIDRIVKKVNEAGCHMERFTSHCFRHTFATRAIEAGMQPQTLKTILGHSSLSMTMDLYSHVLPNTKAEEMGAATRSREGEKPVKILQILSNMQNSCWVKLTIFCWVFL